jgi:hypothetical protein
MTLFIPIFLAWSSLLLVTNAKANGDAPIEIKLLEGDVFVRRSSGVESTARLGDALTEGEQVRTEKNSSVTLALNDGSLTRLGPETVFKVNAIVPIRWGWMAWSFELVKGTLRSLVQKAPYGNKIRFKVKTPTATVGVRGTEFFLSHGSDHSTQLYTFEGIVAFAKSDQDLQDPKKYVNVGPAESYELSATINLPKKIKTTTQEKTKNDSGLISSADPNNFAKSFSIGLARERPALGANQLAELKKLSPKKKIEIFEKSLELKFEKAVPQTEAPQREGLEKEVSNPKIPESKQLDPVPRATIVAPKLKVISGPGKLSSAKENKNISIGDDKTEPTTPLTSVAAPEQSNNAIVKRLKKAVAPKPTAPTGFKDTFNQTPVPALSPPKNGQTDTRSESGGTKTKTSTTTSTSQDTSCSTITTRVSGSNPEQICYETAVCQKCQKAICKARTSTVNCVTSKPNQGASTTSTSTGTSVIGPK